MRIGAHMSVAGGVVKAVDRAVLHGCEALQIFSKNANQWKGRPLDAADVRAFRRRVDEARIRPVVSHASYLINLATTFPLLREQSIAAFIDELDPLTMMSICAPAGIGLQHGYDCLLELQEKNSMSGDGKRGVAEWPKLPRPSSTLPELIPSGFLDRHRERTFVGSARRSMSPLCPRRVAARPR